MMAPVFHIPCWFLPLALYGAFGSHVADEVHIEGAVEEFSGGNTDNKANASIGPWDVAAALGGAAIKAIPMPDGNSYFPQTGKLFPASTEALWGPAGRAPNEIRSCQLPLSDAAEEACQRCVMFWGVNSDTGKSVCASASIHGIVGPGDFTTDPNWHPQTYESCCYDHMASEIHHKAHPTKKVHHRKRTGHALLSTGNQLSYDWANPDIVLEWPRCKSWMCKPKWQEFWRHPSAEVSAQPVFTTADGRMNIYFWDPESLGQNREFAFQHPHWRLVYSDAEPSIYSRKVGQFKEEVNDLILAGVLTASRVGHEIHAGSPTEDNQAYQFGPGSRPENALQRSSHIFDVLSRQNRPMALASIAKAPECNMVEFSKPTGRRDGSMKGGYHRCQY